MKKLISLFLVFIFVLSVSVPAFAAQSDRDEIPDDGLKSDGKIHVYIVGDGEKVLTPGSSFIRYITYYEESDHLIINMNGKDYVFSHISDTLWQDFKEAESKGAFYNRQIRDRSQYRINDYTPKKGYQFVLEYID